MKPICIDLFAGCGGLSLGLRAAGFSILFSVEAHPDAFATYRHNLFNSSSSQSDWPAWLEKRAWRAEELFSTHRAEISQLCGKIDLLAGGPPCQGFTTNGLRHPDDPRSAMVDVYLQYVAAVQPRMVLLENVVGFRSMKHRTGGSYSDYVTRELDRIGYQAWSDIIRAADWGVPQRRPRFVLLAVPKGCLPGVDPLQRLRVARKDFLRSRSLGSKGTGAEAALSDLLEGEDELELDDEWGRLGFKKLRRGEEARSAYQELMRRGCHDQPRNMRLPRHSATSTRRMQDILDTCERGICLRPDDRQRLGISKRSTTPLDPNAPAPTIGTLPDDFVHYARPRSMTVREHARLQSFPDWFEFLGPYTSGGPQRRDACPKFTQVGNAVPPLLAEALGETLRTLLLSWRDQNTNLPERIDVSCESLANIGEVRDGYLGSSL